VKHLALLAVACLSLLGCEEGNPKAACARWVDSVNACVKDYVLALDEPWDEEKRLKADDECKGLDDLPLLDDGTDTEELYDCQAGILDAADCTDPEEFHNTQALTFAICVL
jgi:hypothetical protein